MVANVFVGRREELRLLTAALDRVRQTGSGELVVIRGRRQVGKSRLVQEFVEQSAVPTVFHVATREPYDAEHQRFVDALAASTLPLARRIRDGLRPSSWEAALQSVGEELDPGTPGIVILDEFPYLLDDRQRLAATLQAVWDRGLSARPVLLLLVGSDLSVMERLGAYGSPLYGRPTFEMLVSPLPVPDVADLLDVEPARAFDFALAVGGCPLVVTSARGFADVHSFLADALLDPTNPLVVTGERMLAAEFPATAQARSVLRAIGADETTFSAIAARAGLQRGGLSRPLASLLDRRVVAADEPVSADPSSTRLRRYRVDDAYLRFWLRFLADGIELVHRGRGDLLVEQVQRSWSAWAGRAVEPLIRAAVERLLPTPQTGAAALVGGWWTRTGTEIDLVGIDRPRPPRSVGFVGSIKWRRRQPFDDRDLAALRETARQVPGVTDDTPTVAVSRSGCTAPVELVLTPDDLLGIGAPTP